ncbi:MAG: folylpolyglutamate synthase/dihydrofolate synthase family protein [Candidatus Muiribacteriota bacterium]
MDFKTYVYDFIRDGQKYELRKIKRLLEILGNPQQKFKAIHITGTNGKGSTSTYIEYILTEAGYKTGKFTSPHLVSYNERIRFNCINIPDEEFNQIKPVIMEAVEKLKPEFEEIPSFFEIITAIAYYYFATKKVDYAVIEAGLGGRLDATNTLDNSLTIVTNVDFDHMGILGKTLQKIAFEKVSVLKESSLLVSSEKRPRILDFFKQEAQNKKSEYSFYEKHFKAANIKLSPFSTTFDYISPDLNIKNIILNMAGAHQIKNACMAIKICEKLKIDEKSIKNGLKKAFFPGRLEVISRENPLVVFDGAHNPAGIRTLQKYLEKFYKTQNPLFLTSILRDKNPDFLFQTLSSYSETVYLTHIDNHRVMEMEKMKKHAQKFFKNIYTFENSQKAYEKALNQAKKENRPLFVTGSLYLLGELKNN